jgi:hypothetical protein
MMRLGTMLSFFINLVSRRLAAFPLGQLWTSPSSMYPSWPTACFGQYLEEQTKAEIEPDREADHLGRETVARVERWARLLHIASCQLLLAAS